MELPKRKQNRLKGYDYSTPNAYFITVCTRHRKNLFWPDAMSAVPCPQQIPLTDLGHHVHRCITEIPAHYPAVSVDHFVIMPNHMHLLLQIRAEAGGQSVAAPTIATVVRLLKGSVSKQAGFSVWQKGYYDHVIRNETDYREIWNYIEGNPAKWTEDILYPYATGDR